MALITLTPNASPLVPINIDEVDIYKVSAYVSVDAPGANSVVVYSAPSAFLGDMQSVVVNETVATITALTNSLITLTIGGVATLVNAYNIIDILPSGSGSKILIKEFGTVNTLFATESPSAIKPLFFSATNNTKYAINPAIAAGPLSVSQIAAGYIKVNTSGGAVSLATPSLADFTSAGYGEGSVITFFVENVSIGSTFSATLSPGANVDFNNLNGTAAVADALTTCLGKFEIVIKASKATLSRVY